MSRLVRVVLVVGVAGLVAVLVDAALDVRPVAVPPPDGEDPAARSAGIRAAFAGREPDAADAGLASFFARLGEAAGRKDALAGTNLFDPDRLYAEAGQAATEPDERPGGRRVQDAVWDGFAGGWLGAGWTETRVRRVEPLPGGAEFVVYARHRTPAGSVPARWWLARRDGAWRAYDVEDVRVGLRLSQQLAAVLAVRADDAEQKKLDEGLKALAAASAALAERDVPRAEAALGPARSAGLPGPQRALLCLTEAAIALQKNDPAAALKWAAEAERVRPGVPGADLVRAAARFRQGRWEEAAAAAGRYVALLGPDPQASLVLGLAKLELGDRAGAEAALRPAAEEFPHDAALADALRRAAGGR